MAYFDQNEEKVMIFPFSCKNSDAVFVSIGEGNIAIFGIKMNYVISTLESSHGFPHNIVLNH